MRVVFRVDAGQHIGSGHVMRCLTLADALRQKGAECIFLTRAHKGHLAQFIAEKGFEAHVFEAGVHRPLEHPSDYTTWLGVPWEQDAQESRAYVSALGPIDLMVVDHYALDWRWESQLKESASKILVIDDLANRRHATHILLDQNFGRQKEDYAGLLACDCLILTGTKYALLHPNYARLRETALKRRLEAKHPYSVLISLGGSMGDELLRVFNIAAPVFSKNGNKVTVVSGFADGVKEHINDLSSHYKIETTVYHFIDNLAELMVTSDIVIGAMGATTWERCCLGLPTLGVILANNQLELSMKLEQVNAVHRVIQGNKLSENDVQEFCLMSSREYKSLSKCSAAISDGRGLDRVLAVLLNE